MCVQVTASVPGPLSSYVAKLAQAPYEYEQIRGFNFKQYLVHELLKK